MMKALLFSLVAAFAVCAGSQAFATAVPACTEENEGQTLLLEDGMGSAQVYVCQDGQWIPAEYAH